MPEISRFLGIVIKMFSDEHGYPHFHAYYGEYAISVDIQKRIVVGKFSPIALRAVLEWAELHEEELLQNWYALSEGKAASKIEPLE
jgi:hypothetical protein